MKDSVRIRTDRATMPRTMSRGESSSTARRRGAPWKVDLWSRPKRPHRRGRAGWVRFILFAVGIAAAGIAVLAAVIVYESLSRLEEDREAAFNERLAAVAAAVSKTEATLLASAASLAGRDSVIAAAFPSGYGPRITAVPEATLLVVERAADLVMLLDGRGAAVIKVPEAVGNLSLPAPPPSASTITTVAGEPFLLGLAVVARPAHVTSLRDPPDGRGRPPLVVVGRRVEGLLRPLTGGSPRVEVVLMDDDRLISATLDDLPSAGWRERVRAPAPERNLRVGPQQYFLHQVARVGDQSLWALVPRGRPSPLPLPTWIPAALAGIGALGALAIWLGWRWGKTPARASHPERAGEPSDAIEVRTRRWIETAVDPSPAMLPRTTESPRLEMKSIEDGEEDQVPSPDGDADALETRENGVARSDPDRPIGEELAAVGDLARALTKHSVEAGVIDTMARHIARALNARSLVVLLAEGANDGVKVAARIRNGRSVLGWGPNRLARGSIGLTDVVLESALPLRTGDYLAECARHGVKPEEDRPGPPCWMGVPIVAGGQTLGAIVLGRRDRPFTDLEEDLLRGLADLGGLALRSVRLGAERAKAESDLAIAREQLVRTEKFRAVGEMASGVAHDFNNVLASVVGRTQLLLRHVEDPKLRRWLEIIERSALDGAQAVKRLQEFTRPSLERPLTRVDLNAVVRDALDATESRWGAEAGRGGYEMRVETSLIRYGAQVDGDPAELREALVNLILNAIDAMPRGGVLTVRTAEAGERVELTVSDTGIGIPAAVLPRIFEPFFTTKGPGGTGLGLSMARAILSRHGAEIRVKSDEGQGATFVVSFPRTDVPRSARSPAPAKVLSPGPALSCLVIDDDRGAAEGLGELLTSLGHHVAVSADAKEAVAALGSGEYDVVFTDLSMPHLSGWRVAREVKSRAPGAAVFVVTGFGLEVSADELRAHGVQAVLTKPLRLSDLTSLLATVDDGSRRGGQPPEVGRAIEIDGSPT
jgi:signal transduction histidine kinase/ActR/RegA family two-component response regulator